MYKRQERMRKMLQGSANLEFWETYNSEEIAPYLQQLDTRIGGFQPALSPRSGFRQQAYSAPASLSAKARNSNLRVHRAGASRRTSS